MGSGALREVNQVREEGRDERCGSGRLWSVGLVVFVDVKVSDRQTR